MPWRSSATSSSNPTPAGCPDPGHPTTSLAALAALAAGGIPARPGSDAGCVGWTVVSGPGAFVDEAQIHVRAGNGGAGSVSFRREAHVPRGGPDGGDGGGGGDVWLVAEHNVSSLLALRDHPHRRAGDGTHAAGRGRHA